MLRRSFLKTSSVALVGMGGIQTIHVENRGKDQINPTLSLNAYSFNKPLLNGEMGLDELFLFAVQTGFKAVDLTAYYIPGYPEVPEDEVLFGIKKMAFRLGLSISGTGVRNDFTVPDARELDDHINLVKNWIVAASRLGAPLVRVFVGRQSPAGISRDAIKTQVIRAFRECSDFAAEYGVMVAFQNHNDFIKSTAEVLEIVKAVDSEWFGLMLDIGSIPGPDPYVDIAQLIPYAITWQVKEKVMTAHGAVSTDFAKLIQIVTRHQYHGYFPLETLGEGNPRKKVKALFQAVTKNFVQ